MASKPSDRDIKSAIRRLLRPVHHSGLRQIDYGDGSFEWIGRQTYRCTGVANGDPINVDFKLLKRKVTPLEINCPVCHLGVSKYSNFQYYECSHWENFLLSAARVDGVHPSIVAWVDKFDVDSPKKKKQVERTDLPLVRLEYNEEGRFLKLEFYEWKLENRENGSTIHFGSSMDIRAVRRQMDKRCSETPKSDAFILSLADLCATAILGDYGDCNTSFFEQRTEFAIPKTLSSRVLEAAALSQNGVFVDHRSFRWLTVGEGEELDLEWSEEDDSLKLSSKFEFCFLDSRPPVGLEYSGTVRRLRMPADLNTDKAKALLAMPSIPKQGAQEAFDYIQQSMPRTVIPPPPDVNPIIRVAGENPRKLLRIRNTRGVPLCEVSMVYGDAPPISMEREESSQIRAGGRTYVIERDIEKEALADKELELKGLTPWPAKTTGYPLVYGSERQRKADTPVLTVHDSVFWARFQEVTVPALKKKGWQVETDQLSRLSITEVAAIQGEYGDTDEGDDSYRLTLGIDVDGERLSLLPLFYQLISEYGTDHLNEIVSPNDQYGYIPIGDGRVIRLPGVRARALLKMLSESIQHLTQNDNSLDLPLKSAGTVGLLDDAFGDEIHWTKSGTIQNAIEVFNGFTQIPRVDIPDTIVSTLDDYQLDGVSKMVFLNDFGFSPLLFDEMGLGKTIQLLAFYAIQKSKNPSIGPVLVNVNTAGVHQWKAQAKLHYPSLRVATIGSSARRATARTANQRKKLYEKVSNGEIDLVASVYNSSYKDNEEIKKIPWFAVFADEAQHINGSTAKMRTAAKKINAIRIPATGTPIENNLEELWALVDYANPGYLGSKTWFKKNIATPIEKDKDLNALKVLKTKLAPICRRKRRNDDDVHLEIPEPNIKTVEIDMLGPQRDLYESVNVLLQKKAREELKKRSLAGARSLVIRALTGLRQIACDPRIYKKQKHGIYASCKMDTLEMLLDQFKANNTPAIVFTSFETLMVHFQESASRCGLDSTVISGKIQRGRNARLQAFRDGEYQVLFATLGTTNSSVDLFNAKAVIIYEPWWNPQKEAQGIGRMVRRGQEDDTSVYRFFAKDTVERHLFKKQDQKLALVDAVFNEDLDVLAQELSEDDIRQLLMMDRLTTN